MHENRRSRTEVHVVRTYPQRFEYALQLTNAHALDCDMLQLGMFACFDQHIAPSSAE